MLQRQAAARPPRPRTARPGAAVGTRRARLTAPHAAAPASAPGGGLSILSNTRPVDRLRFQAILVFKHFDTDGDGRISLEQLAEYEAYSAERFAPLADELKPLYDKLRAAKGAAAAAEAAPQAEASTVSPPPSAASGSYVDMETFIDLVRDQVKAASASRAFPRAVLGDTEFNKLGWGAALSLNEVAAALAVFRLLDFNSDNYVKLEDLRKAQGIEREIVEDQLEDADTNEDGFLSFKDFLTSYAKERPVVLNMVVLLAHTATFWFVLNLPMLELPIKAAICGVLLLKPQLLTAPVIKLYTILRTVYDRVRAEIAMAQLRGQGGGAA